MAPASASRPAGNGASTAAAAASGPATAPAVSGSRCTVGYLAPRLHLAQLSVDSAALNTTGTFTPPSPQAPLTGLPHFCDVTLTQTDPAGNAIHIEAWLPQSRNGRFQGVGGAVFACGPCYNETATAISGRLCVGDHRLRGLPGRHSDRQLGTAR